MRQYYCIIFSFLIAVFLLFFSIPEFAVKPAISKDAIAIRVIPNPEHQSAMDWYRSRKFTGSPQNLTVDGYNAVRDGRTVYVNAANINNGNFYTNIYVISYNQDAENATIDIFSRLLKNWEFNANQSSPGVCENDINKFCVFDADCGSQEICLGPKAAIVRDVARLEGLYTLKLALNNYYLKNGHYPRLKAGTYLPYKSISTWPSWQKVLAQELEFKLPVDPINRLGDCGDSRYNKITCWDEKKTEFADSDLANPALDLPDKSRAFVYEVAANGLSFNLCAITEAGYIDMESGACASSQLAVNRNPIIISYSFPQKEPGDEYQGYIKASDPDEDELLWSVDLPSWLQMKNDIDINKKIFYASAAGAIGVYNLAVTISDGKGGVLSRNFEIKIVGSCPLPWGGTLDFGNTVTAYAAPQTACGEYCVSETRICENGVLSGSYTNQNCVEGPCAPCTLPWGENIADSDSVIAYADAQVSCGTECVSETRICKNGSLSGSFTNKDCSVAPCTFCILPWGGVLENSQSIEAFQEPSVACNTPCKKELRTCTNGVLSGTYTNPACASKACEYCITPWGATVNSGSAVIAYSVSSVLCGQSCPQESRKCDDGVLSGTYQFKTCAKLCAPCTNVKLMTNTPGIFTTISMNHLATKVVYNKNIVLYDKNCNDFDNITKLYCYDGTVYTNPSYTSLYVNGTSYATCDINNTLCTLHATKKYEFSTPIPADQCVYWPPPAGTVNCVNTGDPGNVGECCMSYQSYYSGPQLWPNLWDGPVHCNADYTIKYTTCYFNNYGHWYSPGIYSTGVNYTIAPANIAVVEVPGGPAVCCTSFTGGILCNGGWVK